MKLRFIAMAAWVLTILAPAASAGIVYDNLGAGNSGGGIQVYGASGASNTGGAADDFTLTASTILSSFSFYTYEVGSGWDGTTVSTAILGDAGGKPDTSSILFGANLTGSIISKVATGNTASLGGGTATEYLWNIELPDILLNPGDYWFSLYMGYTSDKVYWGYAPGMLNDPANVYVIAASDWFPTPRDVSLRIEGTTIPSPAPLALLGIAFLGLVMMRRRVSGIH